MPPASAQDVPPPVTTPGALPPASRAGTGPERLKQKTTVRVETAPESGAAPKPKTFEWNLCWGGWDGLEMTLTEKTRWVHPLQALGLLPPRSVNLPVIHVDQVKLEGNLGGLLEVDGAAFSTTDALTAFDDGVQLRRARVVTSGDAILLVPFSYDIEIGYVPKQFNLAQAYLFFPNIRYAGSLMIGQYSPPMGLDLTTSSWDITFMEPAAPLQAIAPGTQAGIQIGNPFPGRRGTWALGVFGPGLGKSEYGTVSQGYGNLIGRLTWLALGRADPSVPSQNRFLHVGLSANIQFANSGTIRFQARPESYIAPIVIDTGNIETSGASTVGAEVAWVNGPFSAQGEFIHAFVSPNGGGSLNFGGFYGFAAWFLTGESRPYDPVGGDFARLHPRRNFSFRKGEGWGALEVAVRYSNTDLTDGAVHGGRLQMLVSGLNWYLRPQVKWMFEYGSGKVSEGASDGHIHFFQARFGVRF